MTICAGHTGLCNTPEGSAESLNTSDADEWSHAWGETANWAGPKVTCVRGVSRWKGGHKKKRKQKKENIFIFHLSPFQNSNQVISCHFTMPSYWWEYANATISAVFLPSLFTDVLFFFQCAADKPVETRVSRRCLNHAGKEADKAADSFALISFLESVCLLQELKVKHMILPVDVIVVTLERNASNRLQSRPSPPNLTT